MDWHLLIVELYRTLYCKAVEMLQIIKEFCPHFNPFAVVTHQILREQATSSLTLQLFFISVMGENGFEGEELLLSIILDE